MPADSLPESSPGALLHQRPRPSVARPDSSGGLRRAEARRVGRILAGMPAAADAPIGMVDSGVGGLTVARAVLDQLPHEALHYVGDTANGPYGPKPIAEVRAHALGVMDELVTTGVKALVIACNSASAACLRDARERYDVPVVEVVLPAVRRAVAATRNGRVGVIGTVATITSGAYDDAFAAASGRRALHRRLPAVRRVRRTRRDQRPSAARVWPSPTSPR